MNNHNTINPAMPPVLSFDPQRVHIDPYQGIVTKHTTPAEYENLLAASQYLTDNNWEVRDMPVRVPEIHGYDTAASNLELAYVPGVNVELALRDARLALRPNITTLLADVVQGAVANDFGWSDMAPRNMLFSETGLHLVDFERELRLGGDIPAHWWTRLLHGYVLEELSCVMFPDEVQEVLGQHLSIEYEMDTIARDSISSRRKMALLRHFLSERDAAAEHYPTDAVREVEQLMARVAMPQVIDDRLRVPMDFIEESVQRYGVGWYVSYALEIHIAGTQRPQPAVHTSPTGYNRVRERVDPYSGLRVFSFERPGLSICSPEGAYAPTKTAADVAALLTDRFGPQELTGKKVLELGCGDHALLARTMGVLGAAQVTAADIDPKAVARTRRQQSPNFQPVLSNLFEQIGEGFDVIVFNAPQMPMPDEQRAELPDWHDSPGPRGYEVILQTLAEAPTYLNPNGKLVLMVFDFLLTDGAIAEQAARSGFSTSFIGTLKKPLRAGGQTAQSFGYIQQIFPDTSVEQNQAGERWITGSLLEFTMQ